ncbi:Uncharacterised protein [Acinetobacter baumannii]|nr:Uncharacterised protein [Acinetobacter baumannii]
MPVRGPLESKRKSLAIFESLVAVRFNKPDKRTKSPISEVASIRSGADLIFLPEIFPSAWIASSR